MQVQERGGGLEKKATWLCSDSALIALWGYASAVLSRHSPPPLYGLKSPQTMTHAGHVTHLQGWEHRA